MANEKVNCEQHGERYVTFVCRHVAESLLHRNPKGFFWSLEDNYYWPNAWCSECNERLKLTDWEWVDEAKEYLEPKLLCSDCYEEAAQLNFGVVDWRVAFPDAFKTFSESK